jgi:hypothetical protein
MKLKFYLPEQKYRTTSALLNKKTGLAFFIA